MNYAELILRLIAIIAPALARSSEDFLRLRSMARDGRNPTAEEWNALLGEVEREVGRLREAAAARLQDRGQ